jgi:hypothetical protein
VGRGFRLQSEHSGRRGPRDRGELFGSRCRFLARRFAFLAVSPRSTADLPSVRASLARLFSSAALCGSGSVLAHRSKSAATIMCSVAVRVIGKSAAMSLNFRFRTARAAAELRRVISIMPSSERSSHSRYIPKSRTAPRALRFSYFRGSSNPYMGCSDLQRNHL